MRSIGWMAVVGLVGATASMSLLSSCGGGGGGGEPNLAGDLSDPLIVLFGKPGRFSRTPEEANESNGTQSPPFLLPNSSGENHYFRLEMPFPIERTSLLEDSSLLAPFSYLNGNITVTDITGKHVPGLAMVNGIDAKGIDHRNDTGFPHEVVDGVDRNARPEVFLYVADVDRNLSTIAAFGSDDTDPNHRKEIKISNIDTVRITVTDVNGITFNGAWTIHIGTTNDARAPFVISTSAEAPSPTDPTNPAAADVTSSFVVEFSEPMVPKSVGKSALLDGSPYDGNLPLFPYTILPQPNTSISATLPTVAGVVFVPFDCEPINQNNLATYRLRPLVDLPANATVDIIVRALTINTNAGTGAQSAAKDLSGNRFDGQDADNFGGPDQVNYTVTFATGPGPALVNIPVSPEVVYWLPAEGNGIGAIDLNGKGITTNTPGANAGDRSKAILISKFAYTKTGAPADPEPLSNPPLARGFNLVSGISIWGHPGTLGGGGLPYNDYMYPVGTGSYPYGPAFCPQIEGKPWEGRVTDPGNPGTPLPGVNEGSSGFETLCRDSNGDVILTGRQFSKIGVVQDLMIGEFLDVVYSDTQNVKTDPSFHLTIFNGKIPTQRGNTIADPPTPNPPPLRYWLGLPTIGVVLDQVNPTQPPLLLEGEEVFTGARPNNPSANAGLKGYQQLQVNDVNPNAPDQTIFPHVGVGPGFQSATQAYTFSARQQIGNFLYATDQTSRELHIINSNTMRVITSLALPDPSGLAISPDLKRVYVTNFADDIVSVVNSDPTGPNFHQEVARIAVGSGPRAIAVEPDNEDLFVCNFQGNSVTIIDTTTNLVRKTIDQLISGPFDVEITGRQLMPPPATMTPYGWACGVYFAYVSNFSGNSVVVYESGPAGPQGIGIDGVRGELPSTDQQLSLIKPRGLCASPFLNPQGLYAGGVFVAHQDEDGFGRVSHIQFTQQAVYGPLLIVAPPGAQTPPGFLDRQFEVTGSWGNTDSNRLIGFQPTDVTLCDLNVAAYHARPSTGTNLGGLVSVPPFVERTGRINSKHHMRLGSFACWAPDRLYVAFEDTDTIQVLDPNQAGVAVNTIPGAGGEGVKKLMSYWRQ